MDDANRPLQQTPNRGRFRLSPSYKLPEALPGGSALPDTQRSPAPFADAALRQETTTSKLP